MTQLPIIPVLLPLAAAILLVLSRLGGLRLQRACNLLGTLCLLPISVVLVRTSLTGAHQVYLLGNWIAPFGIVLVLDQLSAMMVLVTSVLALGVLGYAMATGVDRRGPHFHVLFQIQLFGLNGAFLTGDVFNLFVFFEVLLLASYGLLLHGGGPLRTKAGLHYVVINLIGSTLFLFAVGTLYGMVGTLNLADMAVKIAAAPPENSGVIAAAGLVLLVVFGLKAAMFPLYLWLPGAYTHASAPVAALFAIMTKVGLYAVIRVHGTVFGADAGELAHYYTPWVLGAGLLTLPLAALGVMAARRLREQAAYLVLASVATLLIGIGLNSPQALAATLYYLLHSTLIAGGMFLLADVIARSRGSHADHFAPGPAIPHGPLIGSTFMFAAIALTGMPPLSGFFGKVWILSAALDQGWFALILTVMLLSSLVMIIALTRTGSLLFYHTIPVDVVPGPPFNRTAFTAVIWLFAAGPLLVIFASPISAYTEAVAGQQFDTRAYIKAVLNTPATESAR